jgi:hypothetical protein
MHTYGFNIVHAMYILPLSHIVRKKKSHLLRKVKCDNLKYDFLCFS